MKSLLLFDLSGAFWTAWHATKDAAISEAFERTIAAVKRAAEDYDLCVVATDEPPYLRKEKLPTYKANREAQPPMAREQFDRTKARLRSEGFLLWGVKGHEADDVVASAAEYALADDRVGNVVIWSSDKDLACLVCPRVQLYSPASATFFDAARVTEKFGVPPAKVPDWLALVGDKSDNIEGCPGVGPVTAAKLLSQFGSLCEVYLALSQVQPPGLQEKLRAAEAQVRLARELVQLNNRLELPWGELFERREAVPEAVLPSIQEEEVSEEEARELISTPKNGTPFVPALPVEAKFEDAPKSQAIVPMASGAQLAWTQSLEPRSLVQALQLAEHLHASKMYPKFTSPQAILAVVLRGREMGLGAATALDVMNYFSNRVSMSAHLLIARAKKHPDCEWFQFMGGDGTYAEWKTKNRRNPKETPLRYTIEEARLAGMCEPLPDKNGKESNNWIKRPAEMLRKQAGIFLARAEYPEALLGCYSSEEMGASE